MRAHLISGLTEEYTAEKVGGGLSKGGLNTNFSEWYWLEEGEGLVSHRGPRRRLTNGVDTTGGPMSRTDFHTETPTHPAIRYAPRPRNFSTEVGRPTTKYATPTRNSTTLSTELGRPTTRYATRTRSNTSMAISNSHTAAHAWQSQTVVVVFEGLFPQRKVIFPRRKVIFHRWYKTSSTHARTNRRGCTYYRSPVIA